MPWSLYLLGRNHRPIQMSVQTVRSMLTLVLTRDHPTAANPSKYKAEQRKNTICIGIQKYLDKPSPSLNQVPKLSVVSQVLSWQSHPKCPSCQSHPNHPGINHAKTHGVTP